MKILAIGAALAASCLALSGCAGFTVPGASSGAAAQSAFHDFLTDPSCAHHDEATLVTGAAGMPASFQAKVMRDCPARPAGAAVNAGLFVVQPAFPATAPADSFPTASPPR